MKHALTRVALGAALVLGALWLSGCSTLLAIDAVTPERGYQLQANQPYGSLPRQTLDVYLPAAGNERAVPAPVVVFFYGGNWRSGDKADYRFVAQALAERGAIVVVPNYRLYPEVRWNGVLADAAAATAWTLARVAALGGDRQRVYLAGHSAGAWNAAMLMLDPRWLAAHGQSPQQLAGWAGLAGPYDFLPIVNPDTKPVFNWPDTPVASQPLHHARSQPLPRRTLLVAPGRDPLVDPERNTEGLARVLRERGAEVQVQRHSRTGHATLVGAIAWPLRPLAPVLDELARFVMAPVVAPASTAAISAPDAVATAPSR